MSYALTDTDGLSPENGDKNHKTAGNGDFDGISNGANFIERETKKRDWAVRLISRHLRMLRENAQEVVRQPDGVYRPAAPTMIAGPAQGVKPTGSALNAVPTLTEPYIIPGERPSYLVLANSRQSAYQDLEDATPKKGLLSRMFGHVTKKDVAKDFAIGAILTSAARWSVIGAGTAVGVAGVPLVLGSAVAAAVARTAYTIYKDQKAFNGDRKNLMGFEKIGFWEFANINRKKYVKSLATSTLFAGIGGAISTFVLPKIEPTMAPLIDKVRESGFFSGLQKAFSGAAKSALIAVGLRDEFEIRLPVKTSAEVVTPPVANAVSPEPKLPPMTDEEFQALFPERPKTDIGIMLEKWIAESKLTAPAAPSAVQEVPAAATAQTPAEVLAVPAPTMKDKIAALMENRKLSTQWTAIAERAMNGDPTATKDVAKALLNGTNGFERNAAAAVELYQASGTSQAKVDLAYMKFHGLGGLDVDKKGALAELRALGRNSYAKAMIENLTGEGAAKKTASAAMQGAVQSTPLVSQPVVEVTVPDATAAVPSDIPDNASLKVQWDQSGHGVVKKEDVPPWLQDGMTQKFPVSRLQ